MAKFIYYFGAGKAEGTARDRDWLGGKGAGLAEMTRIGLPVPLFLPSQGWRTHGKPVSIGLMPQS